MPGELYDHLVETLKRHEEKFKRLLTPSDYNLICSQQMHMNKARAKLVLKELEKEGVLKRGKRHIKITC